MRTININLIGDLGKASKTNIKKARKKASSDARSQIFAYILLVGIIVVFAASLGGWLFVRMMSAKVEKNTITLKTSLNQLRTEESQLSKFRDDLKTGKKIAEFKIVVQKQLDSSFFPWSRVLRELATKIPKDVIVNKIEKSEEAGVSGLDEGSVKLKISGMTAINKKIPPLMLVSLFIFNLNNNQNSLLADAKIAKLSFNDKTKVYEFEIETSVKKDKPHE